MVISLTFLPFPTRFCLLPHTRRTNIIKKRKDEKQKNPWKLINPGKEKQKIASKAEHVVFEMVGGKCQSFEAKCLSRRKNAGEGKRQRDSRQNGSRCLGPVEPRGQHALPA